MVLTEKNLENKFDKEKFYKFKKQSYNEDLGWDQKKISKAMIKTGIRQFSIKYQIKVTENQLIIKVI